jgi:predicted acetyltransferase
MKIRQITADERTDAMFALQSYAFLPSPDQDEEREERYRRRMVYYASATSLIAEEDGRALAGVMAFPMRQNVRGLVADMAGVAAVASHPDARRRGFVRALLDRLLLQMHDQGCVVSALYPFRPSFYGRFGFVGLPHRRITEFRPEGLGHLLRAELPGTVERLPMRDAFDDLDGLILRRLESHHGWAVYDSVRTAEFREDKSWVAVARAGGEVVGAVMYRIDQYGGDLIAQDMLTTGPLGRALLLQFFARHVDQVERVVVTVGLDDVPELWGTDLAATLKSAVAFPRSPGPMARVLDLEGLAGMPVGNAGVTVEVADDPLIQSVYRLDGDGGQLTVTKATNPEATLTAAGLSGLVYGVLDPIDVMARGFGQIDSAAIEPLRTLFPPAKPYLFADF